MAKLSTHVLDTLHGHPAAGVRIELHSHGTNGTTLIGNARTNADGGAIALGHPLAASGARITTHLLHALRRGKHSLGLGAACIGGGQGAALVIEAYPA